MIVTFDFHSELPLYMQLRNQVVIAISKGELRPGDHLPTVRALSDESGVNTMTISKAYQLLKQEGYITTDRRSGAVVSSADKNMQITEESIAKLELLISELRLSGMNEDQLVDLCRRLYKENEK